jgi:gamma-glutamyltranspeptidase/glutathione hydrolase
VGNQQLTRSSARLAALTLAAVVVPHPARPKVALNGMVATPEPFATEAGLAILKKGGTAFDAAAAVGFALAVTYPVARNVGGGGFLVGITAAGQPVAIDFRETAPAAASRDMFLDSQGNLTAGASTTSYWAIGVPGTIDGLLLAVERFGKLKRGGVLARAIELARDGFSVSYSLEQSLCCSMAPDRRSLADSLRGLRRPDLFRSTVSLAGPIPVGCGRSPGD